MTYMKVKCGQLYYSSYSSQWKKIDTLFSNFGNEAINLRLIMLWMVWINLVT